MLLGNLLSAILLLAVNPCPHLVQLQPSRGKIAEHAVLIIGTDRPDFYQHAHDGFLGHSCHADGGTDGAALD